MTDAERIKLALYRLAEGRERSGEILNAMGDRAPTWQEFIELHNAIVDATRCLE